MQSVALKDAIVEFVLLVVPKEATPLDCGTTMNESTKISGKKRKRANSQLKVHYAATILDPTLKLRYFSQPGDNPEEVKTPSPFCNHIWTEIFFAQDLHRARLHSHT